MRSVWKSFINFKVHPEEKGLYLIYKMRSGVFFSFPIKPLMFGSKKVFLSSDLTSFVVDNTGNRTDENSYFPFFPSSPKWKVSALMKEWRSSSFCARLLFS